MTPKMPSCRPKSRRVAGWTEHCLSSCLLWNSSAGSHVSFPEILYLEMLGIKLRTVSCTCCTLTSFLFFKKKKPTGVVEYLSNGIVADNHKDFKELRYNECLMNFSGNGKNGAAEGRITHGFQLKSAYENNLMPYTNYTFDFKVSVGSMEAVPACRFKLR